MSHSPPSSQLWYWILNIDELTGVEWGKLTTQSSEGKKFNFKIFNKKCFFWFCSEFTYIIAKSRRMSKQWEFLKYFNCHFEIYLFSWKIFFFFHNQIAQLIFSRVSNKFYKNVFRGTFRCLSPLIFFKVYYIYIFGPRLASSRLL